MPLHYSITFAGKSTIMNKALIFLFLISYSYLFSQNQQQLDSIVASKIDVDDPALLVGVVKDGKIIYQSIRGMANLQHKVPADERSRLNIASTAKQFVALMTLDLSLKGQLSLEDDIRKYLPQLYPNVDSAIKVRHLLNHTSGIRDYCDLMGIQQDPWWRREGLDNDDVIEFIEQQEDLAFDPGTRYTYSNTGYTLLTQIIEVASKEDFHEYSQQFFENLGMKNTSFLKSYMHIIPNQALPYSDWGDGVWQQYPMITNLYGDGFLFTTLGDQLIYEQAIQNAAQNNDSLLIKSQWSIPNSELKNYGFGLELRDRLNYKAVHHAGGTGSYNSQMVRYPEESLTIFVMSSNSKVWSGGLADEIASVFLPAKTKTVTYDSKLDAVPSKRLSENLVGQYHSPLETLIRVEEKEDGKLHWLNANRQAIILEEERRNTFHATYDDKIKVGFFEDEMVLFFPSGKSRKYSKLTDYEASKNDIRSLVGNYHSAELDVRFNLELHHDTLMIALDGWDEKEKVEVLNKNELVIYDYILKVKRDEKDQVIEIRLSANRALNNRFVKTSESLE